MARKKLLVFSGADRIGKSTLVEAVADDLGRDDCLVFHHGAPPHDPENIFDFYRDHIREWVASGKQWCLFDRAWPCSAALETFRRHNNGHLDDIIDLELELMDCDFDVQHVLVNKPWSWSAKHHVEEIRSQSPGFPFWKLRDEYVSRMHEHRVYYESLREFFTHASAFPFFESTTVGVTPDVHARIIVGVVNK